MYRVYNTSSLTIIGVESTISYKIMYKLIDLMPSNATVYKYNTNTWYSRVPHKSGSLSHARVSPLITRATIKHFADLVSRAALVSFVPLESTLNFLVQRGTIVSLEP